jgi:hypothetical protein
MTGTADRPGVDLRFRCALREVGSGPEPSRRTQRVRVRDLRVALDDRPPSLVIDAARVEFALADVFERHRLERLVVEQGALVLDAALRAQATAGGTGGPGGGEWTVGTVEVGRLGVRVSDLGNGIPDLTLEFRTTLREVPLGARGLAAARDPQRIELADATLYSPLDPFRKVVHIGSIFVDFTLADLARQEIGTLTLLSPTIYLGEDLVWYMHAGLPETSQGPAPVPWTVRTLRADLGRVMITFNGTDRLMLPITFRTQATNVALGDLATLRFAADLQVPSQRYVFPPLDVELVSLRGALRFNYPRGRDNIVNVLEVDEVRWRDYRITDGWLSVTLDEEGVSGEVGGEAYAGYVNGGLTLPFAPGASWAGWLAGTDVDLAAVAAAGGVAHVEMEGAASVRAAVALRDYRVARAEARLTLDRPGRVRFLDLDSLPGRLPADAPSWQRDLARIGVEAFRDYTYTSGEGTLTFADDRGEARLTLEGAEGSRRAEVHYYRDLPVVARVERPAE